MISNATIIIEGMFLLFVIHLKEQFLSREIHTSRFFECFPILISTDDSVLEYTNKLMINIRIKNSYSTFFSFHFDFRKHSTIYADTIEERYCSFKPYEVGNQVSCKASPNCLPPSLHCSKRVVMTGTYHHVAHQQTGTPTMSHSDKSHSNNSILQWVFGAWNPSIKCPAHPDG